MRIEVRNFQAIEALALDISPGITLISGPNSSGKTALFRAIRSALLNPGAAKSYIRSGTKKAEVSVSDGNFSLLWTRTPAAAEYVINGETFQKVGRTNVWDRCPLFPVGVDMAGNTPNFQTEWDVLFPFGKSPSELFALLEEIFDLGDARGVFAAIRSDLSEAAKNKAAAEDSFARVGRWLADSEALPSMVDAVEKSDQYRGLLDAAKNLVAAEEEVDALMVEAGKVSDVGSVGLKTFEDGGFDAWQGLEGLLRREFKNLPGQWVADGLLESSAALLVGLATARKQQMRADQDMDGLLAELLEVSEKLEGFEVCPLCGQRKPEDCVVSEMPPDLCERGEQLAQLVLDTGSESALNDLRIHLGECSVCELKM